MQKKKKFRYKKFRGKIIVECLQQTESHKDWIVCWCSKLLRVGGDQLYPRSLPLTVVPCAAKESSGPCFTIESSPAGGREETNTKPANNKFESYTLTAEYCYDDITQGQFPN